MSRIWDGINVGPESARHFVGGWPDTPGIFRTHAYESPQSQALTVQKYLFRRAVKDWVTSLVLKTLIYVTQKERRKEKKKEKRKECHRMFYSGSCIP